MPARKEPELKVSLKTTLQKFGGFLKVIAFILGALGLGAGGNAISRTAFPTDYEKDMMARDSIIGLLQDEVSTHDKSIDKLSYRVDVIDQNNVEIKAKLVSIETDIKTLLFYAGESKGRGR